MPEPVKLAVVGLGRIGGLHSQHATELAASTGACRLAAIVDARVEHARAVAAEFASKQGSLIEVFPTVEELIAAAACDACVVCTPTDQHGPHVQALVRAGKRVMVEKSLTGSLAGDRELAAELEARHPNAVMLAFQGRFDEPLQHVKRLMDQGAIGRPFKIVAALEDSGPVPAGYISTSLFLGMAVHNLDDVLWLCGKMPTGIVSLGARVYAHKLSTSPEDFNDGLICLWFPDDLIAQLTVSRNHVSGYRVEIWVFGEEGQIHVGRFDQNKSAVILEAYSRSQQIEFKSYPMRDYGRPVPEFVERFGSAYKRELAEFVRCCREGEPFSVTHRDGLRAMEVMASATRATTVPSAM
ncbi:MAG: Gfo/Idh/MocA family oxidoreductase [Candidatus Acidiferrales bacterium]|jgi:predicted dehydrogenase